MIHPKEFYLAWSKAAEAVLSDPLQLLRVSNSESGVSSTAHNPDGHASGLIQFMPDTLQRLGWTKGHEEFRKLSALEQVPYVIQYYKPYKGKLVSEAAAYVATFLPADLDLAANPDAVLVQKDGRRGWAYTSNAVFDINKDYKIVVHELTDAIKRNARGARWNLMYQEYCQAAGIEPEDQPHPVAYDLGTTLGIQQALQKLGFDPGPIDGIPGKRTRAAVMAFQKANKLAVDGICGPNTRTALKSKLP